MMMGGWKNPAAVATASCHRPSPLRRPRRAFQSNKKVSSHFNIPLHLKQTNTFQPPR